MNITLTLDEVEAIYEMLDQLSGNNIENYFAWDGTDDPSNPRISGMVKLFTAVGKGVSENLGGKV